jgi:hypothetical protein
MPVPKTIKQVTDDQKKYILSFRVFTRENPVQNKYDKKEYSERLGVKKHAI